MAMSALIKSLEDIMRKDAGLNGDAQYIEQITWLLFLKAFDAKEMEWEFRPEYRGSTIPEGFRWRDWADDKEGITGDALIKFVDELFDKLKKLDVSDGDLKKFVIRNVFTDINNYMKSGIYLRQLINRINEKVISSTLRRSIHLTNCMRVCSKICKVQVVPASFTRLVR